MHSERDKMNNYAWWETDGDEYVLMFERFYDSEEIARLYRGEDGDWLYYCTEIDQYDDYLGDKDMDETDAKLYLRDKIISHWEDKRDYYKDMLEKFTSKEES